MPNEGWDLWVKTYNRDPKAMKMMEKYNKQDVVAMEELFKVVKRFCKLPNYNLFNQGNKLLCPNCGSTKVLSNGYRYTATGSYKRISCRDCNTWSQLDAKGRNPR